MDDVSFEFMDDLEPGCVAMYPYKGTVRQDGVMPETYLARTLDYVGVHDRQRSAENSSW